MVISEKDEKDDKEVDNTIWEKGYDRIADLSLLPDISNTKVRGKKTVELSDSWERFELRLTVIYPKKE